MSLSTALANERMIKLLESIDQRLELVEILARIELESEDPEAIQRARTAMGLTRTRK